MGSPVCLHLDQVNDVTPHADGCEDWFWCYADEVPFEIPGAPSYAHS